MPATDAGGARVVIVSHVGQTSLSRTCLLCMHRTRGIHTRVRQPEDSCNALGQKELLWYMHTSIPKKTLAVTALFSLPSPAKTPDQINPSSIF